MSALRWLFEPRPMPACVLLAISLTIHMMLLRQRGDDFQCFHRDERREHR